MPWQRRVPPASASPFSWAPHGAPGANGKSMSAYQFHRMDLKGALFAGAASANLIRSSIGRKDGSPSISGIFFVRFQPESGP